MVSANERQQINYLLHNGDCMLRGEFHRRYSQMPAEYRAELVGGIVFEPSPVSWWHGEHHSQLNYLLKAYSIHTPHVSVAECPSLFLSEEDEVQPDLVLRLSEKAGGNSQLTKSGYIVGAPELVAEISYSSRSIDLHLKKNRYKLAGVIEYIVVCLEPKRVYWFNLEDGKDLPTVGGITRSVVFPGLWISVDALLELDDKPIVKTLSKGLSSNVHKDFSKDLAERTEE